MTSECAAGTDATDEGTAATPATIALMLAMTAVAFVRLVMLTHVTRAARDDCYCEYVVMNSPNRVIASSRVSTLGSVTMRR